MAILEFSDISLDPMVSCRACISELNFCMIFFLFVLHFNQRSKIGSAMLLLIQS